MQNGKKQGKPVTGSHSTGSKTDDAGTRKPGTDVQSAVGITEADKLTVWVLTDNYYDALRPDTGIAKRYRSAPGKSIHAEHGFAYYVESVVNGKTHACMFDYGLDPAGVINNMSLLGLDPGNADAFGLSHGHFDHWSGAVGILKQNRSRIDAGTPFYVGEETFARRFTLHPGAAGMTDLGQLGKEEIENLGVKVVEVRTSTEIIPGVYLTGNIERATSYEKVPPTLLIRRGEALEPDDFRGELAMFVRLKGKGLVVISGCAHAGIVNTVRHARKIAATDTVCAVMGGFHLINAAPEVIRNTVADIKAMRPLHIIPTHCTGFEAITAFAGEMPDEFNLNTAGTRYTFEG